MKMNNIYRNIILTELMEDNNEEINNIVLNIINGLIETKVIVEPERISPVRNENYYESVIPNYSLDDFKAHFRMSRKTFQMLMNYLQPNNRNANVNKVPFEKKVLFALWVLSKQESFLAAGDRFDFAKSTSHNIFCEVIGLIANLRQRVIIWPNQDESRRISETLQNKSGIPGIIGAIDGCHIALKAPPHNSVDYYNRNNYHSVILQGICNDKCEFIDIFVGTPGRVHDARVFRISPAYTMLTGNNAPILGSQQLLGDAAYPLLPFLLKPYRDNGHLTIEQTSFNTKMSSVRSLIEQTFGILKCKFRRLKYLEMSKITAACVLHNFIIQNDGITDELNNLDNDINHAEEQDGNQHLMDFPLRERRDNIAEAKRNYIAALLA